MVHTIQMQLLLCIISFEWNHSLPYIYNYKVEGMCHQKICEFLSSISGNLVILTALLSRHVQNPGSAFNLISTQLINNEEFKYRISLRGFYARKRIYERCARNQLCQAYPTRELQAHVFLDPGKTKFLDPDPTR